MTIIKRSAVQQAYDRALALGGCADQAAHTVAQALSLPVEAVLECLEVTSHAL